MPPPEWNFWNYQQDFIKLNRQYKYLMKLYQRYLTHRWTIYIYFYKIRMSIYEKLEICLGKSIFKKDQNIILINYIDVAEIKQKKMKIIIEINSKWKRKYIEWMI